LNFRGFAWKLDSIISGTNTKLINELKEKWRKFGNWNELVEAVNKGKNKNPLICGGKCRKEILDTQTSNFVIAGVTISTTALVTLAGSIITALAGITKQGQIGKQQREALESAEKIAEMEFNEMTPEEKKAIEDAEAKLRKDVEATDTKKYVWIGVGVIAVLAIGYLVFKNKK